MQSLLIYSDSITPRLKYIAGLLFEELLELQPHITQDWKAFQKADGLRLNYSNRSLRDVFSIKPSGLLFERRIYDIDISVEQGEVPRLFLNNGQLGFDPLAAAFFSGGQV